MTIEEINKITPFQLSYKGQRQYEIKEWPDSKIGEIGALEEEFVFSPDNNLNSFTADKMIAMSAVLDILNKKHNMPITRKKVS